MDLWKTEHEDVDWTHLAQDRDQWWTGLIWLRIGTSGGLL
jgi:hypothetical protein